MTDALYFCPTVREVESAISGGFNACCSRPELHVPMPDSPATAAVSQALSEAVKREAENERVTEQLMRDWSGEATPLHHQLARISMAAWNPHGSAEECRELVRAVVGHPLMPREDATEYLDSLRAECRRVGIPVADTAEEKLARVRALHHRAECVNVRCKTGGWCIGCDPDGSEDCEENPWPCATIRALDEETAA